MVAAMKSSIEEQAPSRVTNSVVQNERPSSSHSSRTGCDGVSLIVSSEAYLGEACPPLT